MYRKNELSARVCVRVCVYRYMSVSVAKKHANQIKTKEAKERKKEAKINKKKKNV